MKTRRFLLLCILILSAVTRLYRLDSIPPSLYTDEANQAYNAVSILSTGRDEHGAFLPISLRSFGDWKPPLQTYLMIPFFALHLSPELSARLPGVLMGIGTVFLTYLLLRQLFGKVGSGTKISLLSSFFLTLSPWHILLSRSAMLVVIALFFMELGVVLWYLRHRKQNVFIPAAFASFTLAFYSYYGMRVIVPLVCFYLFYSAFHAGENMRKIAVYAVVVFGVMLLPLGIAYLNNPDVVFGRAKTVSIFYDEGTKLRQWELISQDGIQEDTTLTRFYHNLYYLYGKDILERFASHFEGKFLFVLGDTAQPFQIPGMGILYLADGLFLLTGGIILYARRRQRMLIFYWLLISLIPASLTFMTPSANRTFTAVVPFAVLTAVGAIQASNYLFTRNTLRFTLPLFVAGIYMISFAYYLHQYFIILPKTHAQWWNFGWKEVVEYVKSVEDGYESIVVIDKNGMPYIYFLLYGNADASYYQDKAIRTYIPDRFGFEHVEGFGKYFFSNEREWKDIKDDLEPNTLYVVPGSEAAEDTDFRKRIAYPDGSAMVKVFSQE